VRIIEDENGYWFDASASGQRPRILALCSDDPQQQYLLAELNARFNLVGAIIEPGQAQLHRLWQQGRYKDGLYRQWQNQRQRWSGRARYRREYFASLMDAPNIPETVAVDWIGSDRTLATIQDAAPHITIVCGTGYIPSRIIAASGLMINIHGGYLPDYRGNHCVFFAYYHSDFEKIGATLHLVTPQLDGGEVIEVIRPPIYPHDNDEHLYCRALHSGMQRLFTLLAAFENGDAPIAVTPQTSEGQLFRHSSRKPWMDLNLWLKRRLLGRHRVPCLPPPPN